jgi:hypothetical protein
MMKRTEERWNFDIVKKSFIDLLYLKFAFRLVILVLFFIKIRGTLFVTKFLYNLIDKVLTLVHIWLTNQL